MPASSDEVEPQSPGYSAEPPPTPEGDFPSEYGPLTPVKSRNGG